MYAVHSRALYAVSDVQAKVEAGEKVPVEVEGKSYDIGGEMVTIEKKTKTVHGQNIIPSVIEPSFGIGRVLYCIFEHTFYARKDDPQKTVFKFAPVIAPIKVTVFPLLQQQELNTVAQEISLDLRRAGISALVDTTGLCSLLRTHTGATLGSVTRRFSCLLFLSHRSESQGGHMAGLCRCHHRQAVRAY